MSFSFFCLFFSLVYPVSKNIYSSSLNFLHIYRTHFLFLFRIGFLFDFAYPCFSFLFIAFCTFIFTHFYAFDIFVFATAAFYAEWEQGQSSFILFLYTYK